MLKYNNINIDSFSMKCSLFYPKSKVYILLKRNNKRSYHEMQERQNNMHRSILLILWVNEVIQHAHRRSLNDILVRDNRTRVFNPSGLEFLFQYTNTICEYIKFDTKPHPINLHRSDESSALNNVIISKFGGAPSISIQMWFR